MDKGRKYLKVGIPSPDKQAHNHPKKEPIIHVTRQCRPPPFRPLNKKKRGEKKEKRLQDKRRVNVGPFSLYTLHLPLFKLMFNFRFWAPFRIVPFFFLFFFAPFFILPLWCGLDLSVLLFKASLKRIYQQQMEGVDPSGYFIHLPNIRISWIRTSLADTDTKFNLKCIFQLNFREDDCNIHKQPLPEFP